MKKIVVVGCFDTKSEVFHFLYNELRAVGAEVITVNTGSKGSTTLFPVDYENTHLANLVGTTLEQICSSGNRVDAVNALAEGARIAINGLVEKGVVAGVVGMGGGGGTYIAINAMKDVPFGIPKVCVSTLATKDITHLIGSRDITLVPSIVDVAGLNGIITVLLTQVAAAIVAMSHATVAASVAKKRIAISMFGNTTACVNKCTELLQHKGFDVYAFHANGSGGRSMEELIDGGYFDGVLDITTTELADELCGGICSAGPERGRAAAKRNIPQVVVPGCLDMVNFGALASVPAKFKGRKLYEWSPDVTLMRTNVEENKALGEKLVLNVSNSKAGVSIVLPLMGLSQIDRKGQPFHSEMANEVLFQSVRTAASRTGIKVEEQNCHINDEPFAAFLVEQLLAIM